MWLEDLQEAIVAQDFIPESAKNVVLGPPEDDDTIADLCIGLVTRPGPTDVTYGAVYPKPNITFVVRSAPYEVAAAMEVADAVFKFLVHSANVEWGTSSFLWFEPLLSPGRLRSDSKHRTDITFEINVWRDEL